jgi:hypothetical protein
MKHVLLILCVLQAGLLQAGPSAIPPQAPLSAADIHASDPVLRQVLNPSGPPALPRPSQVVQKLPLPLRLPLEAAGYTMKYTLEGTVKVLSACPNFIWFLVTRNLNYLVQQPAGHS